MNNDAKITKKDLNRVYYRAFFEMASINYERFQALGFLFAMEPVLKKLYPDKKDLKLAMQRHLEMYNSHPWMINPILGTTIAIEEKIASGEITDYTVVNSLKVGLMGPFAGIGDSLFWGTLRPILGALGAGIALQTESIFGAIVFLVLWNIINFTFRYSTLMYGYKVGVNLLKNIKTSNVISKITQGSSILGLMVLGVLVAQWIKIKTGITFGEGDTAKSLQEIMDGIFPGLLPLLVTIVFVKAFKAKLTPNKLILIIFAFSLIIALINYFTGVVVLVG